jgi:hypothetical protein
MCKLRKCSFQKEFLSFIDNEISVCVISRTHPRGVGFAISSYADPIVESMHGKAGICIPQFTVGPLHSFVVYYVCDKILPR